MKKIITLFLAIMVLASCSTKISLVKRKYSKGYFVSVSKPQHRSENIVAVQKGKVKVDVKTEVKVEVKTEAKDESVATMLLTKEKMALITNNTNKEAKTKSQHKAEQKKADLKTDVISAIPMAKKHFFGKAEKNAKASGDTNTLILVILSLFPVICLIAVYMKDGGITMNFWIDLLLHLTVIGEIIYALLVVLDIFTMA